MKKALLLPIAGLTAGAGLVALLPGHMLFLPPRTEQGQTAAGRYACPMMDFIGDQPGACPVCGMEMTLVTAGELTREQQRRIGLQTTLATQGPARVTTRAHGIARYDNRFTRVIIPRVSGRIVERHMATWGCCETVEAGAPILDLYSPEVIEAQGELQAAMQLGDPALLRSLRDRFDRWNLSQVADALLEGGPLREIITLTAPFGGQVMLENFEATNDQLAVGREVSDDTPLLTLVDPDRLAVVVRVPETRARAVREGQAVAIESDEIGPLPGLKAIVDRVGNEIDPRTRTREVRIYLEGARGLLFPGSLVSALIEGALAPDFGPADPLDPSTWGTFTLVPKSAVLSTGLRHIAWRVAGRDDEGRLRFEPTPLELGPRIEDPNGADLYIVRQGLAPGDEVATQGAFLIDSQAQLAGTESLLHPAPLRPQGSPHAH